MSLNSSGQSNPVLGSTGHLHNPLLSSLAFCNIGTNLSLTEYLTFNSFSNSFKVFLALKILKKEKGFVSSIEYSPDYQTNLSLSLLL